MGSCSNWTKLQRTLMEKKSDIVLQVATRLLPAKETCSGHEMVSTPPSKPVGGVLADQTFLSRNNATHQEVPHKVQHKSRSVGQQKIAWQI